MSLEKIKTNTIRTVNGKAYFVERYGYNNIVLEEHLIPVPAEKIIRIFSETGEEDLTKQKTEKIKL